MTTTSETYLEPADAQQIQDMQTLFQVNRLIIDRSILLILSASKCCLRQGDEYLRGLEARRSTAAQIRVSLSIIMAIVKCSVFGCSATKREPSTPTGRQHLGPLPAFVNLDGPVAEMRQSRAGLNPAEAKQLLTGPGASGSVLAAHLQPPATGLPFSEHHERPGANYGAPTDAGHNNSNNMYNLFATNTTPANSSRPPAEIIGHFLQTLTGTMSAHDAIVRLQLLVGPFASVSSQLELAGQLEIALGAEPPLGGFGRQRRPSASAAPFGATDASPRAIAAGGEPRQQQQQQQQQQLQLLLELSNCNNKENMAADGSSDSNFDHWHHWQPNSACDGANPKQRGGQVLEMKREGQEATGEQLLCTSDLELARRQPKQHLGAPFAPGAPATLAKSGPGSASRRLPTVLLMDKRQLVRALNETFLGELKSNLIERLHEFTDCAYTKHENRETIVALLACVKLQLNRFVRIIYRLQRRRTGSSATLGQEREQLNRMRQLANQLADTCAELDYELQSAAIEQSDELDRCNAQLDLVKQIKQHCLLGDLSRVGRISNQFQDQADQLVEICKMLNQVAPTNKLKISTKTLAIWFNLNLSQLLASAKCLCENPRSRVAKDFAWSYLQVWCSFYDDFCQLARQIGYLAHSRFDSQRSIRVTAIRERIFSRQVDDNHQLDQHHQDHNNQPFYLELDGDLDVNINLVPQAANGGHASSPTSASVANYANQLAPSCTMMVSTVSSPSPASSISSAGNYSHQVRRYHQQHSMGLASPPGASGGQPEARMQMQHQLLPGRSIVGSVQSLDNLIIGSSEQQAFSEPLTDSPRSLDHYHGFGANYRRWHEPGAATSTSAFIATSNRQQHHQHHHQQHFQHHLRHQHQHQATGLQLRQQQQQQSLAGLHQNRHQHDRRHQVATNPTHWAGQQPISGPNDEPIVDRWNPPGDSQGAARWPPRVMASAYDELEFVRPPAVPARRSAAPSQLQVNQHHHNDNRQVQAPLHQQAAPLHVDGRPPGARRSRLSRAPVPGQQQQRQQSLAGRFHPPRATTEEEEEEEEETESELEAEMVGSGEGAADATKATPTGALKQQQPIADRWTEVAGSGDSETDAIVRGARETAQMALSMYQFTRGEGDLNTTQDLFTQAELFAEEANELYKEVRCFSYKVPAGDLKRELLAQLATIPAHVQQLQFIVKNPTVGKAATFAKVDSVIRETRGLMEAVDRVVEATLACRQQYKMASASNRKRTRTLSPTYRADHGLEFDSMSSLGCGGGGLAGHRHQAAFGSRHQGAATMGSEPDI